MRRTFSDGTREIVLTRHELLQRLCALIPPPRRHTVAYFGLFAAHATGRAALTGQARRARTQATAPTAAALACLTAAALASGNPLPGLAPPSPQPGEAPTARALGDPPPAPGRKRTLDWAQLLKRVFALDVLRCDRCGGPREVIAFLTDPEVVPRILVHLGLPSTPPPLAPARAPPVPLAFETGPEPDDCVDPPALD
jgi:hypothetical protein